MDKGGGYDFSPIDPMIEAMNRAQVLPIWDLCHYGYPDRLDPFSGDFAERFADYCRAAARHVVGRVRGPHLFTPINEITFFSFCGGLLRAWAYQRAPDLFALAFSHSLMTAVLVTTVP